MQTALVFKQVSLAMITHPCTCGASTENWAGLGDLSHHSRGRQHATEGDSTSLGTLQAAGGLATSADLEHAPPPGTEEGAEPEVTRLKSSN